MIILISDYHLVGYKYTESVPSHLVASGVGDREWSGSGNWGTRYNPGTFDGCFGCNYLPIGYYADRTDGWGNDYMFGFSGSLYGLS